MVEDLMLLNSLTLSLIVYIALQIASAIQLIW